MKPQIFAQLAGRLMRHPAAPYHEHAVREEAIRICEEHDLKHRLDEYGNLLVHYRSGASMRPVVLAAHLDHPGFEVVGKPGSACTVKFHGGVGDGFFRPGTKLRLMPEGVAAKLGKRLGKERLFAVNAARRLERAPEFAVWELEDFSVRGARIYGRACDDLVGVAAVLAVLIELKRKKSRAHVVGAISRAEEVGFHGALALGANRGLPSNALVISLETSRELPGVKMGNGVIVRIGDRTSVFDSEASRFLMEVAGKLKAGKEFAFQRALMSGGTCEATAYQEFGLQTAAVCVALGNYHNCGEQNKIKAEYVNLSDACSMVALLEAAAESIPQYQALVGRLPARLKKMAREAQTRLKKTAYIPAKI